MPAISSGSRTRPNRCMSAAGSQARKRGQARVHVVHPPSSPNPWMQLSSPSYFFEVEGDVLALFVFVPDHVVRAGDDAAGTPGAQIVGDDLGVQLFPLRSPPLLLVGASAAGGSDSIVVISPTVRQQRAGHSTAGDLPIIEPKVTGATDAVPSTTWSRPANLVTRRDVARALRQLVVGTSDRDVPRSRRGGAVSAGRPEVGRPSRCVVVVVLLGPVEWIIHRTLLHARPRNRSLRCSAPGTPTSGTIATPTTSTGCCSDDRMRSVRAWRSSSRSLHSPCAVDRLDLASPSWLVLADRVGGDGAGLLALLHYEWVHLLVHSRYRPTSRSLRAPRPQPPPASLPQRALLARRDDRRAATGLARTLPADRGRRAAELDGACSVERSRRSADAALDVDRGE